MGNWKSKAKATTTSSTAKEQATTLARPRDRLLHHLEGFVYPPHLRPTCHTAFALTRDAFFFDKPLFEEAEKTRAFAALRRNLSILVEGFNHRNKFMAAEERRDAQISRSGLQFIADEVTEEEDKELHEELQALINSPRMQGIEEGVKNMLECVRDWGSDEEVDPSLIPPSHYWWFYVESEDEDEG